MKGLANYDDCKGRGPYVMKVYIFSLFKPSLQEERPVPTPGKGCKLQLLSFG